MSGDTSTLRLRAGASSMLVFVATVFLLGLIQSSGLELPARAIERGAVDIILPNLAANTTVLAMVVWVEVVYWVLTAIFGIDLYRILADGRSGLLFAPVAIIGAAGLFIIELLLLLGIGEGLAPAYAGATGAEQTAIAGTALALLRRNEEKASFFRAAMNPTSGLIPAADHPPRVSRAEVLKRLRENR